MAQGIQTASPEFRLGIGIPQFTGDSPIPRETGLVINNAIRGMEKQGMPSNLQLFFIAHSVGGIAI